MLQNFLKNSYKGKKQSRKLDGYERDDSLSGQRVQTYYNKDTGKAVVAHRGTSGIHDIITDAKVLLAPSLYKSSARYKQSKKIQEQAAAKYGNDNITTVGHSLGGKLASDVGGKSNKILTYNKAVSPNDLLFKPINKNETHIKHHMTQYLSYQI